MSCKEPGARFSKVPVTTRPVNLPGLLLGFFFGPAVAFLEGHGNLPDIYVPDKLLRRPKILERGGEDLN